MDRICYTPGNILGFGMRSSMTLCVSILRDGIGVYPWE